MFFFKKKIEKQRSRATTLQPQLENTPQVIQTPLLPNTETKVKTYKVTGTSHYLDNIMTLSTENFDYDLSKKELINEGYENERIYQYDFYPIKTELIPEPDNPYDPNAVKVIVDNTLVGYIKAGSCKHILNIIKNDKIKKIDCIIKGGKYKYLSYDYEEDTYELEKSEVGFFVELKITEL